MRLTPNMRVEQFRVLSGPMGSDISLGNNGAFQLTSPSGTPLFVIVSDGRGWEHVSVSTERRCPRWDEMDFVKRLFWDDEETVIQLHPPRSRWINNHPYCLHLWKPTGVEIPLPDTILVGVPGLEGGTA